MWESHHAIRRATPVPIGKIMSYGPFEPKYEVGARYADGLAGRPNTSPHGIGEITTHTDKADPIF